MTEGGPYREAQPKPASEPEISPVAEFIGASIVYGAMLGLLIAFVMVVFVPASARLTSPAFCPPGTVRSSILLEDGIDTTHHPRPVVYRTLMCHDATGKATAVSPMLGDLEIDLVLAVYGVGAGMVLWALYETAKSIRRRIRAAT